MKVIRLGLAVFFIVGLTQADEEFEIKSYSPDTGTVEIKLGSDYTNRPFISFGSAEQQKIKDWLVNKTMVSSSGLSIEVNQRKQRRDIDTTKGSGFLKQITRGHVDQISYSITIENRSQVALDDITIIYRLFYETKTGDEKTKKCANGTLASAAALMPGSRLEYKTGAISIRNESIETPGIPTTIGAQLGAKATVYITDGLKGLYVRISRKDENGNLIKRELEEDGVPDKEDWADYGVCEVADKR